jgi:hypothetical protein
MDEFDNYDVPSISLTPMAVSQEKMPALLAPKEPENVYVNFKEVRYCACEGGSTMFEMDLLVTVGDKTSVVTRKLVINNHAIGAEALNNLEGRKTIYVEDSAVKNDNLSKIRRLAGISYD